MHAYSPPAPPLRSPAAWIGSALVAENAGAGVEAHCVRGDADAVVCGVAILRPGRVRCAMAVLAPQRRSWSIRSWRRTELCPPLHRPNTGRPPAV